RGHCALRRAPGRVARPRRGVLRRRLPRLPARPRTSPEGGMTSVAATAPARVASRTGRAATGADSQKLELGLRLAAFAALCLFATLHWARLVVPAAGGRAFAVALVATAGAAAMGALST